MMHEITAAALELAAKSTLLLAGAFVVARLARRWSSEERHALWALAMLGLLALPAASIFEPGLPVRQMLASARALASAVAAKVEQAAPQSDEIIVTPDSSQHRSRGAAAAEPAAAAAGPHGQAKGAHQPSTQSGLESFMKAAGSRLTRRIAIAAEAAYGFVALLLLAYFAAAALGVELSLRRLPAVTDAPVLAVFEEVRLQLGLR
ncbi:MAG TPA: hypothetical protein VFY39_11960, partial [Gammaproteobacteria bacterium]|nr:hypothetical protein [Gammaproteobacteria bacterium]